MPLLNRPAHSKARHGDRSFSFDSSVRNSILDVRCAPSLSSFKSHLKTYLFCSVYKDGTFSLITAHMCMVWRCYCFIDDLFKNALMCILKKDKLINHNYLPILMFLYIMLACLMLFVYIMLLYFALDFCIVIIYTNAYCFHALSFGY